jgi:DNA recombination protein RmuC
MATVLIVGLIVIGGFVLLGIILNRSQTQRADKTATLLLERFQQEKARDLDAFLERVKGSFSILSRDALSKSVEDFLKLAKETLGAHTREGEKALQSKKELIEQSIKSMMGELDKVRSSLEQYEKERNQQYGSLDQMLRNSSDVTKKLQETTNKLNTALSGSQQRGQWGERMAEDVLKMAGFLEGVQYLKQKQMTAGSTRPDFTFILPQNLQLNMDVKFPLDNYMKYLSAPTTHEKEKYRSQFIRDVNQRVKEVASREYINPAENTVDYALAFIPNEQIYAFIWETDPTVIDRAIEHKVVLCSPITLLAILGVIRQAVENFNLEKTTSQILSLLSTFLKQWEKFTQGMEKMGKRISEAEEEFGRLMSTRKKALERPLRKIDEIRRQKGIESADVTALPDDESDRDDIEGNSAGIARMT